MEKSIAIKLLSDTLQKPFDEAQFRQFARNLVNDLDESKAFQAQGNYIKDAYKHQVRQYKRIGQYVDPDDNTIDVLVVRLQQPTSLDRARTMQRNFIAQYLQDRDQKEAALVAYTTDGSLDWRFSLVRLDYRLEHQADGSYKPKKEVTAARRSSFLVGQTEPNHTAQQQLLPLLLNDRQNPTLDELEAAFNIESVTKEFFEQYKSLFLRVRDEVETLLQTDPVIATDFTQKHIDPANFAKKLLGQVVFLYFLQKKGWLGVEPGQPWGSGAKDFLQRLFERENVEYDNFFNDVLEPLFYRALAVDRGSEALYDLPGCSQPCKIPFLNGGLFEPIGGYDWQTTNVLIANDTIQNILDTFDLYNFTVREDEPLDKEVAVDPEMLGKVFENLLEVNDRKSKGAFYTPREIVHYMCQESLINYLDTTINRQSVEIMPPQAQQTSLFETSPSGQMPLTQEEYRERVPRGDLERLIRQGERAIENDAVVVQKGSETPTYQFQVPESVRTYAAEIDRALADIKICDPAIGSGAFPVGMMQEIVKARGVLTTYLPDEGRTPYAFKRHAIQSSIYGVDIDPGAVDIAKLRLWLSLVVDEEDYTRIKPLPNLDYKIVCGNSLLNVEKNLFNHQIFAELEQRKQEYFEETNADHKAELRATIHRLIHTITNQDETFDFEVYFSEVLQQQGGFDVVIGNPPYIGQKKNNQVFKVVKNSSLGRRFHQRRMDYFYFFFHMGLDILKFQGLLSYITTNYFITATYADKLRADIRERASILELLNFNELKIFESALGQHNIISVLQKGYESSKKAKMAFVRQKNVVLPKDFHSIFDRTSKSTIFQIIENQEDLYEGKDNYIRNYLSSSSMENDCIFEKMLQKSNRLSNVCEIVEGIHTGADKVSDNHLAKFQLKNLQKGQGIYILTKADLDLLEMNEEEKGLIKPWFKNSDIYRWISKEKSDYFLIYYTTRTNGESVPQIKKHLEQFKLILINRKLRSGTGQITIEEYDKFVRGNNYLSYVMNASAFKRGDYYCISYPREQRVFESPKIVVPQRSYMNTFGYNESHWYASADVYFLIQKDKKFDLKFILALLNSKLYYYWLYHKGKRKGDMLELYIRPLSEVPIINASADQQRLLIKLTDEILEAKRRSLNADVSRLEEKINAVVYTLYDLTEDEIGLVERDASKQS